MSHISVIGSGIAGLSASCFLARAGHEVTIYEQNSSTGGRARVLQLDGFTFDMGPSWYWMPDVYEDFFAQFGKCAGDYYDLVQLDPGFQIIYSKDDVLQVPADMEALRQAFEAREPGSAGRLDRFLKGAAFKYDTGMKQLVKSPAYSWMEFARPAVLKGLFRMDLFRSVRSHVRRHFKDPGLISLLEFPVLFLGAMPDRIPALYTLMNHAALTQGTFYPMGGMGRVITGIETLARSLGVRIETGAPVSHITVADSRATAISVKGAALATDAVIAAADYHHVEQCLLDKAWRNYDQAYWESRTLAPSCMIFYLGIRKKLPRLQHHNLFFDTDFEQHARDIYTSPRWPADPLFYACCPSRTDPAVAPEGMENLFVLIPVAPGLQDTGLIRAYYYQKIIAKLSAFCGTDILEHVVVHRAYAVSDFIKDYHAFRGNAYGLANTLRQTAVWKPSLRNHKVKNLFYTGQLTVPGPGLPPALISGELAARQLLKHLKHEHHESAF